MPRIFVEPPAAQPYRYGLVSVLQQAPTGSNWSNGVQFASDACAQASPFPDPCVAPPEGLERVITVDINGAGNPSDVTAGAAVTQGAARQLTVKVGSQAAVTITTGAAAVQVANDLPVSAAYPVIVTDVLTGLQDTGTLTLNGAGVGALFLTFDAFAEKTMDLTGLDFDQGDPFTLYTSLRCKAIQIDELRSRVGRRLALAEPRALESAFWTGSAGQQPALATGSPTDLGAVVGVVDAVAVLEQELAEAYGGIGIIHAPRAVAAYAAEARLIERDGAVLRTPLGTLWAFGGGYDRAVGPEGLEAPTASQTWMYATGAMSWRKDAEPLVIPEGGIALDRVTNEITVLAERTHILTRDCVTLGVVVELGLDVGESV